MAMMTMSIVAAFYEKCQLLGRRAKRARIIPQLILSSENTFDRDSERAIKDYPQHYRHGDDRYLENRGLVTQHRVYAFS